jgi:FeS assembly SUF system protein
MGIFSFLTDRAGDNEGETAGRRADGEPAPAGDPTGPGRKASDTPVPGAPPITGHEALAEPSPDRGTPAGATPEGWDVGALTAPPAKPTGPGIVNDPLKSLELKPRIIEAVSSVFDPEIPVNIFELGLIYDIVVDAEARVHVSMTLTSPACPAAQQLPGEVQDKVRSVNGVTAAAVEVVWEPPWTPDKMSDAARLQLGIF